MSINVIVNVPDIFRILEMASPDSNIGIYPHISFQFLPLKHKTKYLLKFATLLTSDESMFLVCFDLCFTLILTEFITRSSGKATQPR